MHKAKPWHDGTERIWSDKFSRLTPWHYRDGVSIWLSKDDLTPDDDFLGQSVASARGEQLVGNDRETEHDQ